MSEQTLDYAGFAPDVSGLGPGNRIVIWVRGCRMRCPGCMSSYLWEPGIPTEIVDVAHQLTPFLTKSDGITISGGEPFDQVESLSILIDILRVTIDIEILVYTGYKIEELKSDPSRYSKLLQRVDILIDGRFDETFPNTLNWRGSDNQRVHLLSERAKKYNEIINDLMNEPRSLEIQILGNDMYRIIGIPRRGDLEEFRTAMANKGMEVKTIQ